MATVKLPHGSVRFKVKQLPGCCGVAVVYHAYFNVLVGKRTYATRYMRELQHGFGTVRYKKAQEDTKKLFTEFHKYITGPRQFLPGFEGSVQPNPAWPFDLDRSTVLMSDNVSGEIYKFCVHNKWRKSKGFMNYKTGNTVHLFTVVRK